MIKQLTNELKKRILLVFVITVCLLFLIYLIKAIKTDDEKFDKIANRLNQIEENQSLVIKYIHPPVTSNQGFQGEKSHFLFSPDRKLISFVQNVFEEYSSDWSRYWALKVFNLQTGQEKTLVVDDTRMSTYDWLDNEKLRVFHNAGTGFRVYLDVSVNRDSPLFTGEYVGLNIWLADDDYIQRAKNFQEARNAYLKVMQK